MSIVNRDLYNVIYWKDKGFYSWKGKTFVQVTSSIQKNNGYKPITNDNISALFKPSPLKIYRREFASTQSLSNTYPEFSVSVPSSTPPLLQNKNIPCNSRTSIKIDELNQPNGYFIYDTPNNTGINNVLEINLPNSKYELNTPYCNTKTNCLSQESNALKRVRSAGMNRTKYNSCTNSDSYNANTSQYLKSRHKTFDQNQFVYKNQVAPSYFKPNNTVFKKDGGVESSSYITLTKKKNETNFL